MSREGNEKTTDKRISDTDRALIYLVGCAIKDTTPDEGIYAGADAEQIYHAAQHHSVVSMVSYALEKNGYKGVPGNIAEKIRIAGYKAVRKNILLDAECKVILSHMEEAGIKYLPLKGVVLKKLYPSPEIRQMADVDILYDVSCRNKIKAFMEGRGYRPKIDRIAVDECYYKEPVYNFEMHRSLFTGAAGKGMYADYYKDLWDRAVLDDNKEYGYHLKDEDFYVYLLAHAEKHYGNRGTGLRTLADFYILNRKLPEFDRKYIEDELNKLGLASFEEVLRKLADKVFSMEVPDSLASDLLRDEYGMLERILGSGTYGTQELGVVNLMKMRGIEGEITGRKRFIYFIKRLFPDQKTLAPIYPLARYKILIPAVWIFRMFRGLTKGRKRMMKEVEIVNGFREV